MYIVTTEVTAKKASTSVKGGLTRAIRKGICTKQKECEDLFRVVSLYKVWRLKTACEDGTRAWPAKMAREDGIEPAHETAFSSDGVVLRSLGGSIAGVKAGLRLCNDKEMFAEYCVKIDMLIML